MSERLRRWLEGRVPPSVMPLEPYLEALAPVGAHGTAKGHQDSDGPGGPVEELTRAAVGALGLARSRPGRVRDSAFPLLAADALITYACEAAVERDDVESALAGVLRSVGAR